VPRGKGAHPTCPQCGGQLIPGVGHVCPVQIQKVSNNTASSLDWKWWATFVLSVLGLFGTIIWRTSGLAKDLEYMKGEQGKEELRLERIERYFQKPLPPGDSQ
jgi:hypothetical protein